MTTRTTTVELHHQLDGPRMHPLIEVLSSFVH